MDDAILQRLDRIYSAIEDIEEDDLNNLRATVIQADNFIAIYQDFRGDLSDAKLSNYTYSVIHGIANLRAHLKKWAIHKGQDEANVEEAIDNSPDLQIVIDLSNREKHPYRPLDGGRSKKSPRLIEINRLMRLQTQAKKGSRMGMALGADGKTIVFGDGTAKAVITGNVVDSQNSRIGDLYEIANNAVEAWEQLLAHFGLITV